MIGKKIIESRENDMSITSSNCDTYKTYIIREDNGDEVVAELVSTNKFMYSGSGSFATFKKDEINQTSYLYKRELID
jgi:hypothetical protein